MSREEAVSRYLSTVTTLAPDWESSSPVSNKQGKTEGERGRGGGGGGGGGGVGPVVSRMADREEIVAEEEKTVFDWCKEGRDDLLQNHLSTDNINERDTEVISLSLPQTHTHSLSHTHIHPLFSLTHTHIQLFILAGYDTATLGL